MAQALQSQRRDAELFKEVGEALVPAGVFWVEPQGLTYGLARFFQGPLLLIALAEDDKAGGVIGKILTALLAQLEGALGAPALEIAVGEASKARGIRVASQCLF